MLLCILHSLHCMLLNLLATYIALVISIVEANEFRHMITWRMMLWVSLQAIAVLGVGIMARELMSSWQLSEAMDLYDFSYAANLISIVIIGSVVVEFLFAADEYFKPKLYLPMSPPDIEEWKERHPDELSGKSETENDENNSDCEVKDE